MADTNLQMGPFKIGWESIFRMLVTGSMLTAMLWLLTAQMSEMKVTLHEVERSQQQTREDIVGLKTSMRYVEAHVNIEARERKLTFGSGIVDSVPKAR